MPKRINHIFQEQITFTKLLEAHQKTKKGKRFKKQVIEFEIDLETNLLEIGKQLLKGEYEFSEYFEFTIYEPKERKIKTLSYRDRIVQTWYVENFLKPYFMPQFIQDSYACIEGKGTHKALEKMQNYLRKANRKQEEIWVLKCDIRKFFFNINRNLLFSLIKRKIKDKNFLEFTKKIIFYDKEKIGIPIGNYTSQFFANIYMNELDKYIKEQLKIEYMVRYMDDFVLLLKSKKQAKEMLEKIENFLAEKLELQLNSKTAYFKEKQGINFCGFRIWKTHKLLREQSKKKMKRKMRTFQKLYAKRKIELSYITACINSWKGHAKHANSYHLVDTMLNEFVLKRDFRDVP